MNVQMPIFYNKWFDFSVKKKHTLTRLIHNKLQFIIHFSKIRVMLSCIKRVK